METSVLRVLIIMTTVCSLSAKHIYVADRKSWLHAQGYCRVYFTDLSPITNLQEEWVFNKTVSQTTKGWIGLYKKDSQTWRWSGGGEYVSYTPTGFNPASVSVFDPPLDYVRWATTGWKALKEETQLGFFCLNLIVVKVQLTWEDALLYCRKEHTDLTSLLSETEIRLAKRKVDDSVGSRRMWIGLRYLGDRWLWVNGDPLAYTGWPEGEDQDHMCPNVKRCGGLNKDGLLNNFDCQKKFTFICQ